MLEICELILHIAMTSNGVIASKITDNLAVQKIVRINIKKNNKIHRWLVDSFLPDPYTMRLKHLCIFPAKLTIYPNKTYPV